MIKVFFDFITNNILGFISGVGVSIIVTTVIAVINYRQQERFKKDDDKQNKQFNTVLGNEKPGLTNAEANLLRIEQLNLSSSNIIYGECGVGVFWKFNKETKVLEIHGYGPMAPALGFEKEFENDDPESYYKFSFLAHEVKKLIVNEGITYIEMGTFAGYDALEEAYIGTSVRRIPVNCFKDCVNLKHVYLPYKLEEIGASSFSNCKSLMDVSLPRSLKIIEDRAFYGCINLHHLIKNGYYLNRIGHFAFSHSGLQKINLPGVLRIYSGAFAYTTMLDNVEIGYYLVIEDDVFRGSSIKGIKLGHGHIISEGVFSGCEYLKSVEFGDNSQKPLDILIKYPHGLIELHRKNKDLIKIPQHYKSSIVVKIIIIFFEKYIFGFYYRKK